MENMNNTNYDAVIRLNPNDVDVYNNRGIAKANLEHPKAGIPDFDMAMRLNPNNVKAYVNRGIEKES